MTISVLHNIRRIGYGVGVFCMVWVLFSPITHAQSALPGVDIGGIIPSSEESSDSGGYILLEPSIIGQSSDTPTTPSEYLYGIFWFMIGAAGVLAVLVFAIGGIQFMTSGVISQKKDAQEKMTAAIFGLLLALGAWLILNTINPDFVNFDLTLDTVTVTGSGGGTQGVKQTESDGYSSMPIDTVDENGYYAAGKISQERAIREGLAARGIDVVGSQTNEPCEQYRQQGCTDVVGLRKSVFDELDYVVANTDGRITVTGGTEWGHASGTYSHGNGYKVDLRKSANVNAMVADTTLFTRSGTRGDGAPRYINNHTGAEWYDEGDHWDIVTGKP